MGRRQQPATVLLPATGSGHGTTTAPRSPTEACFGNVTAMRITLTSILVEDQESALRFYTEVLGFRKKHDIPVVDEFRWITVVSPEGPDEVELSLEPNGNPAAKAYQKAMFEQGIPLTSFESLDLVAEVERLKAAGVVFTKDPERQGPVMLAMFNDTCGNLTQLHQAV
jgi:catechol 2,3-dioxygenase-like lactoylglutathione lyase family enzyme